MKGQVVFWKDHDDVPGGYGFIRPDGNTPEQREGNYWFGPKSLNGLVVKARDRVAFEPGTYRDRRGPEAARVWLDDDNDEGDRT
jgi:hypothetical protein